VPANAVRAIKPKIEIVRRRTQHGCVQPRIDVVGPGFVRSDAETHISEGRAECQRHERFAGTGAGGANDEPRRSAHRVDPKIGASAASAVNDDRGIAVE
jgi:hypothetical protein